MKGQIEGAVSSSDASTEKLKSLGITVFDLNEVDRLGIYVDGADEINGHMQMIKGGGAALTREKSSLPWRISSSASRTPQAGRHSGEFPAAGRSDPDGAQRGCPSTCEAGRSSGIPSGCGDRQRQRDPRRSRPWILDAIALENAINGIPGVVTVGLFANRGADVALIGTADGVKTIVK